MGQSRTRACNKLVSLKETINLRFFQNEIPPGRWRELAEEILFRKINENKENIEKFKNLNALRCLITPYWRDDYKRYSELDSITHQTPYANSMLVEAQSFYSLALLALTVGVILLINHATEQGQLDKRWWVGMVPEKNFPSSRVPASPFSFLMLALAFCSMMLYTAEFKGNIGYINLYQSRNKMTNALDKIMLYPEGELNAFLTTYKNHHQGEQLLTNLDWRDLFNRINQLKKTGKPTSTIYGAAPHKCRYSTPTHLLSNRR